MSAGRRVRALWRRRVAEPLHPLRLRLALRGCYARKVFCVGRNKTGTTTMEAVLRLYRYRVAPQARTERLLHDGRGALGPEFRAWMARWEAFQDAPFSATWCVEEIFALHPDALYILTRRDPEQWFASLVNHHFSLFGLPHDASRAEVARALRENAYIAPGHLDAFHRRQFAIASDDQLYDKALYIENLRAHEAAVRALIPKPQLLEIDVSEHADTGAICRFLGIPEALAAPMPRENRRR